MRYRDGQPTHVGDTVTINVKHQGTGVGRVEDGIFLNPHTKEQWTHLHHGVLIDASLSSVVHYADKAALEADHVRLAERQP